jgi:predicted transcriptional regulator
MATLNIEVSDATYDALQAMAAEQQVPVAHLIESLVEQPCFELSEAQMQEADLAIGALDRGEVASDATARAFFQKYGE